METTYSTSSKRARLYKLTPIADRFWAKVKKGDDCWLWTGSHDDKGYGHIRRAGKTGPLVKAHRLSWELHHGSIADEMNVLHRCDTPACVRPNHLFLGSFADNSRDAAEKGRLVFQQHPERCPRGEDASAAKLTKADVAKIRALRADGWTQTRLAARFGVSQTAIWLLLKGRTWKA